ncbi:hypothetical protein JGH11_16005 [Dysgonomonas sp. Marseille-P4677]|uniref:hypothetical protein n=1 Tax=Dysgonomonas sp. Marseille-P4677 TaxID=2364790 RepID=UPI001914CF40|nr:hypothetical protein [Dysgonomonas sp. Marseille-P4677]MBK5722380.1 hypothetical protein [Dysgonomonas sp. Marseille-P4677]
MKTTYNRSKIMKLANKLRKDEELSMSQALTLAWSKARRDEFYLVYEVRKAKRGSIMHDMNMLAESLTNYYANNTYNGD